MFTSRVKKYELNEKETEAIRTVLGIIDELNDEDFFEDDPFYNYCPDEVMSLMNDLLDNDCEPIG